MSTADEFARRRAEIEAGGQAGGGGGGVGGLLVGVLALALVGGGLAWRAGLFRTPAPSPTPSPRRSEPAPSPEVSLPPAVARPTKGETPPSLALDARPLARTSSPRLTLSGVARDDSDVTEVLAFVNGEPVSAHTKGVGGIGKRVVARAQPERPFSFQADLRPGVNLIEVCARDDSGGERWEAYSVLRREARGSVHAAVIGISAYRQVRPLSFARRDAEAFRDYLQDELGVPPSQVHALYDEQATQTAIKKLLGQTLVAAAGPEDTVLVFFSGHGGQERDASAGISTYLYPVETVEGELFSTALATAELAAALSRIRAGRLVFLADCCYGGALRDPRALLSGGGAGLAALTGSQGRVLLSACKPDEVARESPEQEHGLFTYFLLEGLRGAQADLDQDGQVDSDELSRYVEREVTRASQGTQHPFRAGSGRVNLGPRRR